VLALLSLIDCQSTILQDFMNQTFVATQSFASSVHFCLCTFTGCTTRSLGGALYVLSASASLSIVSCYFVNCHATASETGDNGGSGGAFYVHYSHDFLLGASPKQRCSAGDYNGAFTLLPAMASPVASQTRSRRASSL
jgi:hypothetical protein